MREIYSQATWVLIWLGEAADNSTLAMEFIRRWGDGIAAARRQDSSFQNNPLEATLQYV